MTYELTAKAQKITRLTAAQKLVLMRLCQVANEEKQWRVWNSQAQIAIREGLGEKTVRRALDGLAELKLIRVGHFEGEMLGRNVYQVDPRRVRLMGEQDELEAEEKISEGRVQWREKKAHQRIKTAIVRDLRLVTDSVDKPVDEGGEGQVVSRSK